jgi:PAS domain S-box-containing protein
MEWHFTLYAMPFFAGAGILLMIAVVSWQRRTTPGAIYLSLLSLLLIFSVAGYGFEIGSTTVDDVLFWFRVEYIGLAPVPPLLLMLILAYTNRERYLTPLIGISLFVIPTITLLVSWSNQYSELMWRDFVLDTSGEFTTTVFTRGDWYWINTFYTYIVLSLASFFSARSFFASTGVYRRQQGIVLIGTILPFTVALLRAVGIIPIEIDFVPISFVVVGVILAFGLFYYRWLDIVPVAQEAILSSMTDIVIVLDIQRRVVDLNPAAQLFLGQDASSAIGRPSTEVFSQWGNVVELYRDVESERTDITIDVQGESRTFDMRMSALKHRGKTQGRLVVLRDITDKVQAQLAIEETNQRLEALRQVDAELSQKLDVKYVATMAIDVAMRMSRADNALIALVEGDKIRIIHAIGEAVQDVVDKTMAKDAGITARVIRTQTAELVPDVSKDPDYFAVVAQTQAQITVPLLSNERLVGVMTLETYSSDLFTQDVFDIVKLLASRVGLAIDNSRIYEDRDKLVSELDAFAHTVAHDLKNPLSIITGCSTIILEDDTLNDEIRDFVDAIHQSGNTSVKIIDTLLLLAGVRSAETVDIVPLDMAQIVTEVQSRHHNLVKEHDVQIITPDEWKVALGCAPWVEEILANFFSNAIKYGGRPPRVEFGCDEWQNDMVRFWVRDNGKGLTPEDQAKLFQPFTRLGQVNIKGHGLGLSIVQRIAVRLNGEVGVESDIGKGSLFYFSLPVTIESQCLVAK